MGKVTDMITLVDSMFTEAANQGLMLQTAEGSEHEGREVRLDGRRLINFGSCSYLGLETDARLRQGVIDAVTRYGTQFSSSRSYVSSPLYQEAETLISQIFGAPALAASSTSLGHLAAIPVLVGEDDAIILDQQVHHSVQTAANQTRLQGTHVEIIRHSRMDLLEERLADLQRKHRHVWYMTDGVYSMFADCVPLEHVRELLERNEQFHFYVDDSHGMSWTGQNGRGHVLGRCPIHPRMAVAASLNKSFASSGGALVFPEAELRRKVRTCGGPLMFSGPIQPPMLGAIIASAKIHLSEEITVLQTALMERIRYCNRLLQEYGLPVVALSETPIRYVGMGLPRVAYTMCRRMMERGFYVNPAPFPAVPMKQAGVRFTLTLHHSLEDIRAMLETMAELLPGVLADEGTSLEEIRQQFGLPTPIMASAPLDASIEITVETAEPVVLKMQHETTIEAIAPEQWDALLGDRGSFSWAGMRMLEKAFQGQQKPEDNWGFHYYIVRDAQEQPVAATFFTDALWKDDMLSAARVSAKVEQARLHDPYFLTSRMLAMGSLLTEGDHLFLDRSKDWRQSLTLILRHVSEEQERVGAAGILLRDFDAFDEELASFLSSEGFVKSASLASAALELDWREEDEFLARLSQKARRHQKREVMPWNAAYSVEVLDAHSRTPSDEELAHFHRLYLNVKERNLGLNTFALPEGLFAEMLASGTWELVLLRLSPEFGGAEGDLPVGVSASFVGEKHYAPLVFGLDYRFVESHGAYRQLMRRVIQRAQALGKERIFLGLEAALEKSRFGAKLQQRSVFTQFKEHYNMELLAQFAAST